MTGRDDGHPAVATVGTALGSTVDLDGFFSTVHGSTHRYPGLRFVSQTPKTEKSRRTVEASTPAPAARLARIGGDSPRSGSGSPAGVAWGGDGPEVDRRRTDEVGTAPFTPRPANGLIAVGRTPPRPRIRLHDLRSQRRDGTAGAGFWGTTLVIRPRPLEHHAGCPRARARRLFQWSGQRAPRRHRRPGLRPTHRAVSKRRWRAATGRQLGLLPHATPQTLRWLVSTTARGLVGVDAELGTKDRPAFDSQNPLDDLGQRTWIGCRRSCVHARTVAVSAPEIASTTRTGSARPRRGRQRIAKKFAVAGASALRDGDWTCLVSPQVSCFP